LLSTKKVKTLTNNFEHKKFKTTFIFILHEHFFN